MGKKKGKGKSQAQGASGDQPKSDQGSSDPPPSTSQEQEVSKTSEDQQKKQPKQRKGKGQQVTTSPPTQEVQTSDDQPKSDQGSSGPRPSSSQEQEVPKTSGEQQKKQPKQRKGKGQQVTTSPPTQETIQPSQQQQQRAPPPQQWPTPQQPRGPQQQPQGFPPEFIQRGPPQQQPSGFHPQQQQFGPPQQHWGPQQGGPPPMQQHRGPPQMQQYGGPPQMQQYGGRPQMQQHGGPPHMQQYGGPPHTQQGQQQQFRGQQPMQGQQQPGQAWGRQTQSQMIPPPGMQQQGVPPGFVQPVPQQQPSQGPQPQQSRQSSPQQQQQSRQGPPQQQQSRQGPPQKQQSRQGPPQQQQSRQGPPQQQQARKGAQQKETSPPQQQQGSRQQTPTPSSRSSQEEPKEQSPPFGGQGDCLKQLALVKPGTKGRKIYIESNHLALNVGGLKNAYHYDVALTPDTPKCLLRDVMNIFGKKHYPNRHPAFDGRKNLYSPTKLPFDDSITDTIKVEGENREKEFKVEIKLARTVDLTPLHNMLKAKTSPQDALQCLDIVLRNAPSNTCITAGRCFFTPPPPGQIIELGDGMEMYYGFYQSAIRGWKPLLNVDVAHKAFPQALEVLDLICELGSDYRNRMTRNDLNRPLYDSLSKSLEKFLKMLKVKYEITNQSSSKRIYRVNGLGEAPSKANFKLDDGKVTTVEKYFQDVKRIRLRYPHLPTLWVGARDRESKILLPLEFCTVVGGQPVNRKMNENQTSAMIKKSATSTEVRKQKIMNTIQKASFNNDPCIREFGFSVNNQFEKLEARVLQPPSLLYANNSVVKPSKGVWRNDRSKFLQGAVVNKWTIACVTRQPCKVEQLADMIYKMAESSGMTMAQRATPPFVHVSGRQMLQDIIQYFKTKRDFDLIFVVVPNSGPQYSYVKQAAELNVGCLTQCIKERTLFKLNTQTAANILLKVNSKLNGRNHTFFGDSRPLILARPCMIMGADVTHPSPDARDIPSVAAVTASHDPKAFQYNICWRLQPPRVEIIEDLCNIVKEQLTFFYKKTGCKPEKIVFFRDGVSEGQFREVQRAEISAIQRACRQIQADGYEPAITFLVVQKRHHTRLFPTNPRDSEDRNMNVPAGTCVDTIITNPTMQDFYLVSHASIQGVAKPTKYCTLWDDNKMTNDDIEELAYHLCHMFTRCNRSVSYPAPTYYAHLAAARAKVYIENDKLNMDQLQRHQESYQIMECISKGKPMFFV